MVLLFPLTAAVLHATIPYSGNTNTPMDSWSFNDTTNWTSDLGYAPVSFTNLSCSWYGDGSAVVLDYTNPAVLQYRIVENDNHTNLTLENGSLLFWFAPGWSSTSSGGSGAGTWTPLIQVGEWTQDASYGFWGLYADPAGDNLYFFAQANGAQITYLSVPIDWTVGRWNQIVLSYSATNSSLYLDGALATNGLGVTLLPGADAQAQGFFLGSNTNGVLQSQGMFDDFSTYDYQLDATNIARAFDYYWLDFYGNPMNPANDAPDPIASGPQFPGTASPMDSGGGRFSPMDGSGGSSGGGQSLLSSYPSNSMFLDITDISNGIIDVTIFGTIQDVNYEILSKQTLTDAVWVSEGMVLGETNETDTTVTIGTRTNSLFLWARSYVSSDGSGLPTWWEQLYFGTNAVDPYALCPSGDGLTILYAYEHGLNPLNYYTPSPPQNVTAKLDSTGTNIIFTWASGGGPVTQYAIEEYPSSPWVLTNVNATTSTATVYPGFAYPDLSGDGPMQYQIRAYYSHGNSTVSPPVTVETPSLNLNCQVVRGPSGNLYLAVQGPVPAASQIILTELTNDSTLEIDATNLVNGVFEIPTNSVYPDQYELGVQAVGTNGQFGAIKYLNVYYANEELFNLNFCIYPPLGYFANAAASMKENLKFLLRSATPAGAFGYVSGIGTDGNQTSEGLGYYRWPEMWYARPPSPASYEYYGFHTFSPNLNCSFIEELRPVRENYLWRNFLYEPSDFNGTMPTNGVDWTVTPTPNVRLLFAEPPLPTYEYQTNGAENPLPLALTNGSSSAFFTGFYYNLDTDAGERAQLGFQVDGAGELSLPNETRNVYGLTLDSVMLGADPLANTLWWFANGPAGPPASSANSTPAYYTTTDLPGLQTVGYYFASQDPFFNYIAPFNSYGSSYNSNFPAPPLPGSPTFSVTNAAPVLITSLGQPMTVSGWAQMQITNGYSGQYAYLEQYFDHASTIGTNGLPTTNSAGLLSPYGEFFPTQPGPAALVTMPDIETGKQGTGIVNVIKLQLDVNHDGKMDLSLGGPDNTSQYQPFVFWINNDADIVSGDYPAGVDSQSPPWLPDYASGFINSQRDLEDYARLWICGMPALPASSGYRVSLAWTNVLSGNPGINLFVSAETNGGIGYLTNTNIAVAQTTATPYDPWPYPNKALAEIFTPIGYAASSYTFPDNFFTNNATKYFLFEGTGAGSGELVLTIYQGTNVIAQTGAWLDLHDIKDFYEAAVITNNMSGAISNWTSAVEIVQPAASSALVNDTNLIVLIHGIDVQPWDCANDAETVLKRLYWAGYHGAFAEVKWPCNLLTPIPNPLTTAVFNLSELQGYKASQALTTYLTGLRSRFPGYRLHLLVHSQGNAVVSEAIENGAPFDTYILTQGAMPASAYDVNAPTNATLLSYEHFGNYTPDGQPMGYHGIYTNLPGRIVNLYNPFDKVLGYWIQNQQLLKPSIFFSTAHYFYNGTNSYFYPFVGPGYLVTDPQESRAMVARSRTDPIGRSGPASAHGVIKFAVDLNAQFGFNGDTVAEHSAQWSRPIQTSRPYFQQVLTSCQIQPAP